MYAHRDMCHATHTHIHMLSYVLIIVLAAILLPPASYLVRSRSSRDRTPEQPAFGYECAMIHAGQDQTPPRTSTRSMISSLP